MPGRVSKEWSATLKVIKRREHFIEVYVDNWCLIINVYREWQRILSYNDISLSYKNVTSILRNFAKCIWTLKW